jgi:hypothetical protein
MDAVMREGLVAQMGRPALGLQLRRCRCQSAGLSRQQPFGRRVVLDLQRHLRRPLGICQRPGNHPRRALSAGRGELGQAEGSGYLVVTVKPVEVWNLLPPKA